jgi:RNA polymerase sigma-70 factor (ECF subfamily)
VWCRRIGAASAETYGGPRTVMNARETTLTPERLHARYAGRIARRVQTLLGHDDEREDLVQEVLITVLRNVGTLRNPDCMDGWVNQVTLNTLRAFMRQRRKRRHASWEGLLEHELPWFQADPDARELAGRVMALMNRLPHGDRALLESLWFSRATAESIAAQSGCSIITVRRRLFRARSRFTRLARKDPALARCLHVAKAPIALAATG